MTCRPVYPDQTVPQSLVVQQETEGAVAQGTLARPVAAQALAINDFSLQALPEDLLCRIIDFLDIYYANNLRCVCTQLQTIIKNAYLSDMEVLGGFIWTVTSYLYRKNFSINCPIKLRLSKHQSDYDNGNGYVQLYLNHLTKLSSYDEINSKINAIAGNNPSTFYGIQLCCTFVLRNNHFLESNLTTIQSINHLKSLYFVNCDMENSIPFFANWLKKLEKLERLQFESSKLQCTMYDFHIPDLINALSGLKSLKYFYLNRSEFSFESIQNLLSSLIKQRQAPESVNMIVKIASEDIDQAQAEELNKLVENTKISAEISSNKFSLPPTYYYGFEEGWT